MTARSSPGATAPVPLPGEANRGSAVRAMFDRIAPSYDLLNRVMTLRVDQRWRRRLIRDVAPRPGERLLDLCAGTMDVAAEARRRARAPLPCRELPRGDRRLRHAQPRVARQGARRDRAGARAGRAPRRPRV